MKNKPFLVKLEKGKTYAFCQCEKSDNQPFCDGSHSAINVKDDILVESLANAFFSIGANRTSRNNNDKKMKSTTQKPLIIKAEKDDEVNLCGCKQSENAPYCNGTHLSI